MQHVLVAYKQGFGELPHFTTTLTVHVALANAPPSIYAQNLRCTCNSMRRCHLDTKSTVLP